EKPALVRGFVDASLKAWDDTRKNPDEAIDVFRQSAPEKSREIARAALVGTLPLLESEGTRGRPLGFQSESDWDSTLQAIALAGVVRRVGEGFGTHALDQVRQTLILPFAADEDLAARQVGG